VSNEEMIFRDVVAERDALRGQVQKVEGDRNAHQVRANELDLDRGRLRERLDAVTKQRDDAEERLRQLASILRESHDELISLATHRTLLVAALLGHAIEIEGDR